MSLVRSSIENLKSNDIALIGIPFDEHSSFLKGPALAPPLIIESIESDSANYFTENLTDLNEHTRIKWCGNILFKNYFDIQNSIHKVVEKAAIPFSLGGDHSVTYPILRAVASKYKKLNILHFDAHGDLYDELLGNRYSHACPFARIMEEGLAERLVQVGVRTMNTHQMSQVKKFGVEVFAMKSWSTDTNFHFDGPVYLSFDIDVLDPAFAPGVSHFEPGGFTTREVLKIIQNLNCDIIGADVVEYNPDRDIKGMTGMVAAKIVKELLDKML